MAWLLLQPHVVWQDVKVWCLVVVTLSRFNSSTSDKLVYLDISMSNWKHLHQYTWLSRLQGITTSSQLIRCSESSSWKDPPRRRQEEVIIDVKYVVVPHISVHVRILAIASLSSFHSTIRMPHC